MKKPTTSYKEAYVPGMPKRCYLFPKTLSDSLTFPVAIALKKRGFSKADLLRHWDAIIGAELGQRCEPVKLVEQPGRPGEGVLHIRTRSVYATEIQHSIPIILERLATYYGYRIASRVTILQ